jgi:hypothetical protein
VAAHAGNQRGEEDEAEGHEFETSLGYTKKKKKKIHARHSAHFLPQRLAWEAREKCYLL